MGSHTNWTQQNLVNQCVPVASGEGWREERTGLHQLQFLETRRHWFTRIVPHDTNGGVNVLNLVEGDEAMVESPTGPSNRLSFTMRRHSLFPQPWGLILFGQASHQTSRELATLKAFVRP